MGHLTRGLYAFMTNKTNKKQTKKEREKSKQNKQKEQSMLYQRVH